MALLSGHHLSLPKSILGECCGKHNTSVCPIDTVLHSTPNGIDFIGLLECRPLHASEIIFEISEIAILDLYFFREKIENVTFWGLWFPADLSDGSMRWGAA